MARLRVIRSGEKQEEGITMAEAIEALAKECIAANPAAVFMVWEAPSETEHMLSVRSLPDASVVRRGFIDTLSDFETTSEE